MERKIQRILSQTLFVGQPEANTSCHSSSTTPTSTTILIYFYSILLNRIFKVKDVIPTHHMSSSLLFLCFHCFLIWISITKAVVYRQKAVNGIVWKIPGLSIGRIYPAQINAHPLWCKSINIVNTYLPPNWLSFLIINIDFWRNTHIMQSLSHRDWQITLSWS